MARLIAEEDCEHLALTVANLQAHLPHCAGVLVLVNGFWTCTAWGCRAPLLYGGRSRPS